MVKTQTKMKDSFATRASVYGYMLCMNSNSNRDVWMYAITCWVRLLVWLCSSLSCPH